MLPGFSASGGYALIFAGGGGVTLAVPVSDSFALTATVDAFPLGRDFGSQSSIMIFSALVGVRFGGWNAVMVQR